jgi:hypothetical protein
MRRIATVCLVLILAALLIAPMFDATAQNIKVMTIGRSLNSMTPPIKGAAAPPWNISTGLTAVGTFSRVYFKVDTLGSGAVGTPTWTLTSKPASSTATLDSTGTWINSVKVDLVGPYVVSATVGGKSASDTVYASTYTGVSAAANAGCACHGATATAIKASWLKSKHASIFFKGMTGQLEVQLGKGAYATACIKCHTTGWDATANNNNFGYQVKQTGWDTTWYKGLQSFAGDYWITTGDSSKWNLLSAGQMTQGTIGCENCHGPSADHKANADPTMIGKSLKADVCNQCHDGSRRHSLGTYFNLSKHAILPTGGVAEGGRSNCQPCHTGKGFLYYLDHNKDTTGIAAVWNTATDANTQISCQVCHDPHGSDNVGMLRTTSIKGDSLRNGYILPAALRSNPGLLCANCHSSRYSVKVRVKPASSPYYGFTSRFGPHENPQADMFFGSNGYQFGDTTFTGVGTHQGLEDMCVTCHMQGRMNYLDGSANILPNHSFGYDTTFATGVYKPTDVCSKCHGEIDDFDGVKAFYDYDRNGKIEGVETEITGLLAQVKAILPKDGTGEVIGSGSVTAADSLAIKGRLDLVAGIWNYRFVTADKSMGAHNAKYAVRLLYKTLGWTPLFVKDVAGAVPSEYALSQNYPNPFNPSTVIRFALPKEQHVKLDVYDMTGSLVKTILNEAVRAGNKEVTWDGTSSSGTKVASGMYLYRLQAGDFSSVKKMILLK